MKKRVSVLIFVLCMLWMGCLTAAASPESVKTKISVNQKVDVPEGKSTEFFYELKALNEEDPLPEGSNAGIYRFSVTGAVTQDVELTFTHAGNYEYELRTAEDSSRGGYVGDPRVYHVTVQVKNGADGLEAVSYISEKDAGKTEEGMVFLNSYRAEPTKLTDMPNTIARIREKGDAPSGKKYKIVLMPEGNQLSEDAVADSVENPMPDGTVNGKRTITIKGHGKAYIGRWSYTEPGVYWYSVHQSKADGTVYTIIDTVTNVDGQLMISRQVERDDGKKVTECVFVNEYEESSSSVAAPAADPTAPAGTISANTGDQTNVLLWVLLIVLAAAGLGYWYHKRK